MSTIDSGAPGPAPYEGAVRLRALWFGILAAPTSWAVLLLAGSSVVGGACTTEPMLGHVFTVTGAWVATWILGIAATLVGAAGLAVAWHSWSVMRRRRVEPRGPGTTVGFGEAAGEGRARYMAFGGILLSVVFLAAILFNYVPFVFVPLCAGGTP
ncbi:MAG TPA: hypothetical protein VFL93_08015 [Longimicrobiaceae bacterium]|jgi:hypothetical protein|nr:hypothetical protein [Longimicrobiaceae bacterium]